MLRNQKSSELGRKDQATVTPDGHKLGSRIKGVEVRPAIMQTDERGELCEIYNPAWGYHPDPLIYVYHATIQPGKLKGWVYHKEQDDRIFNLLGRIKVVLYDMREDSETFSMINEFCFTERNRALITFPKLVAHALQNVGDTEAVFINMPTKPYNHANPDKYRIPIDSGQIPYDFSLKAGW